MRIDDTDTDRNNEEYVKCIFDSMEWMGLEYDKVFRQSEKIKRYQYLAKCLVSDNKAVYSDGAIFLNTGACLNWWEDDVAGKINADTKTIEEINKMVLIKSDGMPSYHFATVVDDGDLGINMTIRGTDHINNTIKQLHIYHALGWKQPHYAHVGLIHQKGKKISKRDGTGALSYYIDNGYSKEAVLNALLMMGWGHPDPHFDKKYPLVTKQAAIKLFPEGKMRNSPASLNIDKLNWYNKVYKK